MAHLVVSLFGALRAGLDGVPLADFRYDKVRALLAFLAVEADRPHRRDALVGLLWPDLPEDAARANLRQALATLRSVLGDRGVDPHFLLVNRESVQWNPTASSWVDITAFAELVQTSSKHLHRHPVHCRSCAQRYTQAVELYQGRFLDQFFLADTVPFEEWAALKREALQRQALDALAHLVAYHERCGEYALAEKYARRQLELEPWHEAAYRHLMRLLVLGNQRSQALVQYEQCRHMLAEELGVEPDAETTALCAQIRAQTEELPARAPRLGLPTARTHNLPPQATPFVDRDQELADIAALLDNPSCRLLTLVGIGGIGKTRLALQAATEQLDSFDHGVYFIPLAPLASADLLVAAIGEAVGCPLSGPGSPKAQILSFLRHKEMLLVLDNFEHLLEGAGLLGEILTAAEEVSLLVTSRERLALQGEWIFEVHGLAYPPKVGSPPVGSGEEVVDQYSAVRLFLQTAARLQPGYRLAGDEFRWVAQICRLVEGMPLAIELAAAWVRVLSCREIAEQIEQGIEFLSTSLRDVPLRHRSLRAVFDHSWQMLSTQEQAALRKLSVFRGGCLREAAEAVTGASLPVLATLVDKSWLRRTPTGRYALHELVRQYGWEGLQQAGEARETQEQHLAYFADLAETAEPHLYEILSPAWLEWLEAEIDNLRAALAWSLAGGDAEAGLRLGAALWLFWWMRGHTGEGRAWLTTLLDKTPAAPVALRAKAMRAAGGLVQGGTNRPVVKQQVVCPGKST